MQLVTNMDSHHTDTTFNSLMNRLVKIFHPNPIILISYIVEELVSSEVMVVHAEEVHAEAVPTEEVEVHEEVVPTEELPVVEDEWRPEVDGKLCDASTISFIEPMFNSTEIFKPKKSVIGNLVDYSDTEDEDENELVEKESEEKEAEN